MTLSSFVAFVESLPGLIVSFFERPPAPVTPVSTPGKPLPAQDPVANLKGIILANTIAMKTLAGGQIHQLSASEAYQTAKLMVRAAQRDEISLSLFAAQARLEADYDSQAYDHNSVLSKPGETAEELFDHTDWGFAQEDGAVADADPAFAALPIAERKAKLEDLSYGVDFMAKTLKDNLNWANAAALADPSLMQLVPNQDVRIIALTAYNVGQRGMADSLRSGKPNLTYGIKGVKYADDWKPLLG